MSEYFIASTGRETETPRLSLSPEPYGKMHHLTLSFFPLSYFVFLVFVICVDEGFLFLKVFSWRFLLISLNGDFFFFYNLLTFTKGLLEFPFCYRINFFRSLPSPHKSWSCAFPGNIAQSSFMLIIHFSMLYLILLFTFIFIFKKRWCCQPRLPLVSRVLWL